MKKHLLFYLMFFLALNFAWATNQAKKTDKTVKNAKIIFKTGKFFTAKKIVIKETQVQVVSETMAVLESYPLDDIQRIETLKKNFLLPGALIGAGVGLVSMLIIEAIIEKPKTSYSSGPGWSETLTITREMAGFEKGATIIIGVGLGILLGRFIKTGGKTIYQEEHKNLDMNFHFYVSDLNKITPVLTINYRF